MSFSKRFILKSSDADHFVTKVAQQVITKVQRGLRCNLSKN